MPQPAPGHPAQGRGATTEVRPRTFLIADVRGYTAFTRQHGDEAAARLASAFAQVAREAVAARGGRVIELRGDEALAVFDAPRQAVIAAVELQQAMSEEEATDPSLPLRVGVGIDCGEAVPVEGGYRGKALNLAARLCSRAGPGEVLATQHLVTEARSVADIDYEPLGAAEFKGFHEPIEVIRVVAKAPMEPAADGSDGSRHELPGELDPLSPLLAGRDHELDWLRGSWRLARRGHGRLLFIASASGRGRTRLAAELAVDVHREGASVFYASAVDEPGSALAAVSSARSADGPTLLVLDDAEAGDQAVVATVEALSNLVHDRRLLALCAFDEERAAAELVALALRADGAGDALQRLEPLDVVPVAQIAALYTGDGPPLNAPALHAATAGEPRRVHELAAEWALDEARDELEAAAGRAGGERRSARAVETDLSEKVMRMQLAGEQARVFSSGADGTASDVSPFKGLATFEAADAQDFFGRERLVAELAAHLVGSMLVGVVGPSGSGKSSAVRAGLLPALAGGMLPGSERWRQRIMRPGEHPLNALDDALVEQDAGGLIVFIDQFEEVFTTAVDAREQDAFIERLVGVVDGDDDQTRVVLALRADYYGHCAAYARLADLLADDHVLVGAMREDELRRAIELPARRAGLRVEPELTDALVRDVIAEPGGLPLLSTALLELWQLRDGRHLRLEHYEATGGVRSAVGRLAETAFEHLTTDQQVAARRVLLRLAGVGEGDTIVRRRAAVEEFEADSDQDVAAVLDVFTRDRLLTTSKGSVEVAHEALFREWPRLAEWLAEDAQGRVLHAHLSDAARHWQRRDRDLSELYRGARLASAREWAGEHSEQLNALERDFLEASRLAGERELQRARRTNRRLRGLLAGVGALLLLAVGAGVVAINQRQDARSSALMADTQRLGAVAQLEASVDRSLLLARQAVALKDSPQSRGDLLGALARANGVVKTLRLPFSTAFEIDVRADGRHVAASGGRTVAVLDTASGSLIRRLTPSQGAQIVRHSPDGRTLATFGVGDHIQLYDTRTWSPWSRLATGSQTNPWGLSYAPDGRSLMAISNDQTSTRLIVWRARGTRFTRVASREFGVGELSALFSHGGKRIVVFGGPHAANHRIEVRDARTLRVIRRLPLSASAADVSQDGHTLAVGTRDGSVRLVDLNRPRSSRLIGSHRGPVQKILFTPNRRRLVSSGRDKELVLWDVSSGERIDTFSSVQQDFAFDTSPDGRTLYHNGGGTLLARDLTGARRVSRRIELGVEPGSDAWEISEDGRRLIGVRDGRIIRRDLRNRRLIDSAQLPRGLMPVNGVTATPDGKTIALLGRRYALWSVTERRVVGQALFTRGSRMYNIGFFHPNGRLLFTYAYPERVMRRWDVVRGRALAPLQFSAEFYWADVSPDGRRMAVAFSNGIVQIHSTQTGRRLLRWRADESHPWVAYSPDGALLATGRSAARLWDARTGRAMGRPLDAQTAVGGVDFSRDGRMLATTGDDGTTFLHDVKTQRRIGAPLVGESVAGYPIFTTSGSQLIVTYQEGPATVWDMSVTSWIRRACATAGRTLTRSEWDQFLPGRPYRPACKSNVG